MRAKSILKIYRLKVLAVLFFILFSTHCYSQNEEIKFQRLTVENGLSHNNVYSIIQDKEGYMWFGTQDGLNRYDGYKFSVFRHNPNDSNSISTSNFGKIYQDEEGIFWFGTYGGGLDKYDPKTNLFTNYANEPNNSSSISMNNILFLHEDVNGYLWIGTSGGGLNKFDKANNSFIRFEHNPEDSSSLSNERVNSICETTDGTIWVATVNGLNKLDIESGTFQHIVHESGNKNSLSSNNIQNLLVDKNGNIWIATKNGGLNKYNPKKDTYVHYKHKPSDPKSISDNYIERLFIDSYNQLWIGTHYGGLNKFDTLTNEFTRYKYEPKNINSISSNRIEYIYEDHSHNLWIATRGGGINRIDLKPKKINIITYDPAVYNGLSHPNVMAIEPDSKNNLWIGTDGGGLSKYNLISKSFKHFRFNKTNANSISSNRVWSILAESNNIIWVGTYLGGLNRLEFRNGHYKIDRYRFNPNDSTSLSSDQVNSILKDNVGNIWVATVNGLCKLIKTDKPSTYSFKRYYYVKKSKHSYVDNYFTYIYQDSNNRIWVGSHARGLAQFDPKTDKFIYYATCNKINSEINHKLGIISILEFKKDILLLGTEETGLIEFNVKNSVFSNHPINNHIKSKMVNGLLKDDFGLLWITTGQELINYNPATNEIFKFTQDDGLISAGFNRNSISKCQEGNIYVGGTSSLAFFNPSNIEQNLCKPKVAITDIRIASKSIWNENLLSTKKFFDPNKEIVLHKKDYMISIEFAALDFTSPEENNYKYQLEGLDKTWVNASKTRTATYTTLPPDSYTFKVIGSNNDNFWNDNPTILKIKVLPPLWKKPWFIAFEALLIVLSILFYIRWKTNSLLREKRNLEIKIKKRTEKIQKQNAELEKLSIVASKTDNAVYIINPNGNIEWVNEGFVKMHGYTLEEFILAKGSNNILEFSINHEIEAIIHNCILNKETVIYSCLNKTKKGQTIWLQTTITPILDNNGDIKKLVAIDSDITRLKLAEEEITKQRDLLKDENATKNKFFRIIAHDLRNPMGTLVNFSELILNDYSSIKSKDLKAYIDQFYNLSKTTFCLLENLLQWSSSQAGRIHFNQEQINLSEIIRQNIDLVKANSKNINLITCIKTECHAYADENMIKTVIRNLLSNALKFTPNNGTIEVSCIENKDFLYVTVKDSGIGINKEDQNKLFKTNVHHSTLGTSNEKGSGLGLILCKEFVEKNKGTIKIESEPNKGTAIIFSVLKYFEQTT